MFKVLATLAFAVAAVHGADPAHSGQTVMAPSSSNPAEGTSVLHPQAGQPSTGPAANMHPAIVESSNACACHAEPKCDCAPKKEYVSPELKCETSPCSTHPDTPAASCGCLHLETCACKKSFVAPELAAPHRAPEVVEKTACEAPHCQKEETHVQPQIVDPAPKCGEGADPCALHSNEVGVTHLKPTTTTTTTAPAAAAPAPATN